MCLAGVQLGWAGPGEPSPVGSKQSMSWLCALAAVRGAGCVLSSQQTERCAHSTQLGIHEAIPGILCPPQFEADTKKLERALQGAPRWLRQGEAVVWRKVWSVGFVQLREEEPWRGSVETLFNILKLFMEKMDGRKYSQDCLLEGQTAYYWQKLLQGKFCLDASRKKNTKKKSTLWRNLNTRTSCPEKWWNISVHGLTCQGLG